MIYDRITRLLHLLFATGIVVQLVLSLIMVYPKPGRLGDSFYALHATWGQVLLGLLVVHWIWCLVRKKDVSFTFLFPWFSPSQYRAILEDIKRHIDHATHFSLPDTSHPSPLASAVQGLGLSVATLLGVSGTLLFFGMEADGAMMGWLHDIKEAHEVLGTLLWIYLVIHAIMGMLHQWAGHGSMRAMVRVWEKNPQPTIDPQA